MNEPLELLPEEFTIEGIEEFINNSNHSDNQEDSTSNLSKVLETQKKLRENMSKTIIFSEPILKQKGLPFLFPNTINVIQGKKGQHKSRLAEHICSVLLKAKGLNKDILDFQADTKKEFSVCLIDTERNISQQLPYALQQIQKRAGYNLNDKPKNFEFISLLEIDRNKRFDTIRDFLEHLRRTHDNHILIVLDVLTDCVENFNDPKDSLKLIDLMNKTINEYDVTFLCVIHENPFSDKARGHLGTELINKASTVLQVAFVKAKDQSDTDLIKVSFLHCRSTKKHEPFYMIYSEEEDGLVIAEHNDIVENLDKKNHKANIKDVADYLGTILNEPLKKTVLLDELSKKFDCDKRTIEERLKAIIEEKTNIMVADKEYFLIKSKNVRNVIYKLELNETHFQEQLYKYDENNNGYDV